MNILIVTPHFYPENFRINDFALEYVKWGHKVSVLTGTPDYPSRKFFKKYGFFKKNNENYKGIKIYRAPLITRGSGSNFRLALNYMTYVLGALLTSLFLLKKKYDIIFVFEPSPITIGIPAIFIKKIKKIPICFWVLDLWPESVISAGNLKTSFIPKLLNPIVKFIYNNCDKILVSSNGFKSSIVEKGIDKDKIHFFPQWAESLFKPVEKNYDLLPLEIPKDSFKIMFAGNIGEAQDFSSILKAAKKLKNNKNIHWIIIGDGRRSNWVKAKIIDYKIQSTFHMLGRHDIEKMPEYYSLADAMLFTLKDELIFSLTIPAKVQSYLACRKPILAMINGEASKIIEENKTGYTCPAGDFDGLVQNIIKISSLDKKELDELAENSLKCYQEFFERDMLLKKAEDIFFRMIKNS